MAGKSYRTPITKQRIRAGQTGQRAEAGLAEIMLIEGMAGINDQPITLDPYQIAFMCCNARFRCVEKARQTGFSWIMAAESAARAILRPAHTGVFLSYNLSDATEKVRYAKMILESLPREFRKKIVEDAKTAIGVYDDATHTTSRIKSFPSKAPRGLGGDVYLDELAHYMRDEEVYMGSTALITRHPLAQLTVCSTPAGRRGMFWQIARAETDKKFKGYLRFRVPWWLSTHYTKDIRAARAAGIEHIPTEQRVYAFGKRSIQEQFETLLLEDFQQEFECAYIDAAHSYYPWNLINSCAKDIPLETESYGWNVRGRLIAGYDVGRRRDVSALCILEEIDGHYFVRYLNMWYRLPFGEQEQIIRECLQELPVQQIRIDENGIGMNLAENMTTEFGIDRVLPVSMSQPRKELIATDVKTMMEKGDVTIPRHRDLTTQMHAIRRTIGEGGKPKFDTIRNARHHGDLFWAFGLAAHKERSGEKKRAKVTYRARVAG